MRTLTRVLTILAALALLEVEPWLPPNPALAQGLNFSNYIQSLGGNVGVAPQLIARGTDTNIDLHLNPKGTGAVELGPPDAAAPVAQTLGVNAVIAGTSNTAGVSLTIQGGEGTGTGVGGNLLFAVAYPGSTGSTQNAFSTVTTINGTNNTSGAGPTVLFDISPTIAGTGTNAFVGLRVNVTETTQGSGVGQLLALSVAGTQRFGVTDGLAAVGTRIRTAQATVPTCTTNCGSPGNVCVGTDSAGICTAGTAPATAFVIAFNGTWEAPPSCTVTQQTSAANYVTKALTATTSITVSTAAGPTASDKFSYVCLGVQ